MEYDKKEAALNSAFIGLWKKGKENNQTQTNNAAPEAATKSGK